MATQYFKDVAQSKFENACQNINTLYQQGCVTWGGKTKKRGNETQELYSEMFSRYLLEHLDELHKIAKKTRKASFKVAEHNGTLNRNIDKDEEKSEKQKPNRDEEWVAFELFKREFNSVGKIFDYQVPLTDEQKAKNGKIIATDENSKKDIGRIDLVSYNKDKQIVYLLELKHPKNKKDGLLKCILETYTYCCQLDHKKFMANYNDVADDANDKIYGDIVPAILIFDGSVPHKQFLNKQEYANTNKLLEKLNIKVFVMKSAPYRIKLAN